MTEMQLSEYNQKYDHTNNFDFPNNPYSVLPSNATKKEILAIPYQSVLPFIDNSAVTPIKLIVAGTFTGASRDTYMRSFSQKFYSKNLKRFWVSDTKFLYCFGSDLRGPSLIGRRNNFNDYVAIFLSPIPFWYSGTESTYSVTTVGATAITLNDATANSTGAFANTGTAPAHITHIAVERTSGTITGFNFGDKSVTSAPAVAGDNIINWTGTSVGANEILHFFLIHHVKKKGDKWYYFKTGGSSGATIAYGTAESGTATTLTDSTPTWTVNTFANWIIYIKSGTGAGQIRRVISNTANVITVKNAWDTNPSSDSVFSIGNDAVTYGTRDFSGDDLEDGPRVIAGETDQDFSAQITGTSTPQGTIRVYWRAADYVK